MKVTFTTKIDKKNGIILIPFFQGLANLPSEFKDILSPLIKNGEVEEKCNSQVTVFGYKRNENAKIHFVCLGAEKSTEKDKIRSAIAKAIKILREKKINTLTAFLYPGLEKYLREIGEGIGLANYTTATYKTGKDLLKEQEKLIQKVVFVLPDKNNTVNEKTLLNAIVTAEAVNKTRDIINAPHNYMDVEKMAKIAKEIAGENNYEIEIFEKEQLEKMKMGALLAVNKGSSQGAKMVVLKHLPQKNNKNPIVLVGKGITFDTGGINLKPTSGLSDMHMDMAGAGVVLGVFMLLKKLAIKKNVIGIIPLTDNAIDAGAQMTSDIITSYSGKTIQVGNTDAEGRLILVDGISYAVRKLNPKMVIDIATLTGACMVALGDQIAGMFGNDDYLKTEMSKAADNTNEDVWPMPIHKLHRKSMKSEIADLNNVDSSGLAGACTAAAFIEAFVDKKKWIHLDIAGPTMPKKPKETDFPGASGYGVRLITEFISNIK